MKNILIIFVAAFMAVQSGAAAQEKPLSLTMDEAVGLALRNNPRIHQAREEIDRASALKRRVWALPEPELMLMYEGVPVSGGIDAYGNRKLFVTQRFDFPLNYFVDNRRYGYMVDEARERYEVAAIELRADVKEAYIAASLAQEKRRLAEENRTLTENLLEKSKLRYELGEEGRQEFLWARLQYNRAENALETTTAAAQSAMERLAALLSGINAEYRAGSITIAGSLEFEPLKTDLASIRATAVDDHVLSNANRYAVRAAKSGLTLAKMSYFPEFMFAYFDEDHNTEQNFWGMRLSMSVPLWFLTDQNSRIGEARSGLRIAELRNALDTRNLRADLNTAVAALRQEEKRVRRFDEEILTEAQELYDLAELSYREGETGYIDLLLAQQALIETRGEYLDAIAAYRRAVVRLERAAGFEVQ